MRSKGVENDELRPLPQSASSFNTHDEMKLQNAKVLGIGHLSNFWAGGRGRFTLYIIWIGQSSIFNLKQIQSGRDLRSTAFLLSPSEP